MRRGIVNSLILVVTIAISSVFFFQFGSSRPTFHGDAFGYYLYLPSTFIYQNLKAPFSAPADQFADYIHGSFISIRGAQNKSGFYLNQYTYGVALMESPFFFIAHAIEKVQGKAANGYSDTYSYLIKMSGMFYAILGMLFMFRVLRHYFSYRLSLLTVVCIFLCTNLFWFSIFQAGMAHIPLFFLYSVLVFLTIKIHDSPSTFRFIAIGFTSGLITLIRPSDILCLLIPVLYDVYNMQTIHKKIQFITAHKKGIALLIVAFIIPIIPQLLYWKSVTGSYICYSYGSQSFNWSDPKIIEGLFCFSNGFFPYAPVMIFAVLGMLFYKQLVRWEWCIGLVFAAYVYIVYSWYCYTYINGFGSRPMIHIFPLLAISLAAFFNFISGKNIIAKSVFITVCLFFAAMNLCYSVQQHLGVIDSSNSTMAFNFQMLFRTKLTYDDLIVKDVGEWQPDEAGLQKLKTLVFKNFDDSLSADYIKDTTGGSKFCYHMHDRSYLVIDNVTYHKETFKDATWLKCSGRFLCPWYAGYDHHVFIMDINEKRDQAWGIRIENNIHADDAPGPDPKSFHAGIINKWGKLSFFVKIPGYLKEGDNIKLYMWVTDKSDIYLDDIAFELYK